MALRDDFNDYWDGNKLLAPNPVSPGTLAGSDNGTLFTSEWYVMLQKSGQLTPQDLLDYHQKIQQCINAEGMLCRVPVGQDGGPDQVDDYYGVSNACVALGNTSIPRQFLKAIFKYFGSLNNVSPGMWTADSFLIRQMQLLCCIVTAAFPSWNPLHVLVRLLFFPIFLYSAIIIALANITCDPSDSNDRRLAWHLQNCLKTKSLMCWLASKIWLWRLYRTYPNGMNDVAGIYYKPAGSNPYQKYWIT